MKIAAVYVVAGVMLLAAGCALSPAPWLGFIVPGIALVTIGLLRNVE